MSVSDIVATFFVTAAHGWDPGSTVMCADDAHLDARELELELRKELRFPIRVSVTHKEGAGTHIAVTRLADE